MHTTEKQILLSILHAVASAPDSNPDVCEVLDRKLGRGWMREFAECRSQDDRMAMLRRRMFAVESRYAAFDLSMAGSLCNAAAFDEVNATWLEATSFEDGGAR